jgi:DNA polymerase III sliding clamp (beta) subunit (PCNA family)
MKDDLLIHKSIIEYILKNMSHTITFNTSSKYKVITWHNIIIICGNDLKFPLYKMIIPQDVNLEYAVTMNVDSFLEGFKYFKAANPDREAFIWYNNKIASIVQNRWGNEYDIENLFDADVQIEGTMHTEFSFSCTLVKEIISKYKKHKTVKMKMPTFNQNPVIITCDKTPYEFVVLMPVRCKLSVFVGDEPLYPFTPKAEVEAV